jgi:thiosulfate dehydrogenase
MRQRENSESVSCCERNRILLLTLLCSAFCLSARNSSAQNASPPSDVSKTMTANSNVAPVTAPDPSTIPQGPLGDSIRLGLQIFTDTPKYAAAYVGNKTSCGHCHIDSGTKPYAMSLIGVSGMFPEYRQREKEVVTLEERIEQCFQRSEFGHRVPNNSPEMTGLVAYAQWLSKDQIVGKTPPGRGVVKLPDDLTGDVDRGSVLYAKQCALCHGADGAGQLPTIPALWGSGAYSDGAGMNNIDRMAAFVQHNMPQTNPGSLTPQQAFDVAAYVHSKPHPHFDIKDHLIAATALISIW